MKVLPGILMAALLVTSTQAQTPAPTSSQAPNPPHTPSPSPASARHVSLKYKAPPGNLTTGTRHDIDGGTRGWTPNLPALYLLAPNHTGLTTRPQPTFFWYQSAPTNTRMEFTLIVHGKPGWLLRTALDKADQPGIHRLSLERYHVSLTPGVIYRWSVALVPNPSGRSQDLIASDLIQRVEPTTPLAAVLHANQGLDKAAAYAANGIWYDALETISDESDPAPGNPQLHSLRASLLDQVGLKVAAAAERR